MLLTVLGVSNALCRRFDSARTHRRMSLHCNGSHHLGNLERADDIRRGCF